jgi:hypothetical protein
MSNEPSLLGEVGDSGTRDKLPKWQIVKVVRRVAKTVSEMLGYLQWPPKNPSALFRLSCQISLKRKVSQSYARLDLDGRA